MAERVNRFLDLPEHGIFRGLGGIAGVEEHDLHDDTSVREMATRAVPARVTA
jgi:hypothetical protein